MTTLTELNRQLRSARRAYEREVKNTPKGGINVEVSPSLNERLRQIEKLLEQIRSGDDVLFSVKQGAEFLSIAPGTLRRLASQGKIEHTKSATGKLIYFSRRQLLAWAQAYRIEVRA